MFIMIVCPSCRRKIQAVEKAARIQGYCPTCEVLIRLPATKPTTGTVELSPLSSPASYLSNN